MNGQVVTFVSFCAMENTCDASSRVGVTISTRMRFRLAFLYLRVTVGIESLQETFQNGQQVRGGLAAPRLGGGADVAARQRQRNATSL